MIENAHRMVSRRLIADAPDALYDRFTEMCRRERRAKAEVIRFLVECWCDEIERKRAN